MVARAGFLSVGFRHDISKADPLGSPNLIYKCCTTSPGNIILSQKVNGQCRESAGVGLCTLVSAGFFNFYWPIDVTGRDLPTASPRRQRGTCGPCTPRKVDLPARWARGRSEWTRGCCGTGRGTPRCRGRGATLSTTRCRILPRSSALVCTRHHAAYKQTCAMFTSDHLRTNYKRSTPRLYTTLNPQCSRRIGRLLRHVFVDFILYKLLLRRCSFTPNFKMFIKNAPESVHSARKVRRILQDDEFWTVWYASSSTVP